MVKSAKITIMLEPELRDRVVRKSEETGVPYSEVIRRALEHWVDTGEMLPVKPQEPKGGKPTKK